MKIQTKDAAKLMGVTDKTIQNYVNRGVLTAQIGRHGLRPQFEYELDDVINFAEKNGIRVDAALVFDLVAAQSMAEPES